MVDYLLPVLILLTLFLIALAVHIKGKKIEEVERTDKGRLIYSYSYRQFKAIYGSPNVISATITVFLLFLFFSIFSILNIAKFEHGIIFLIILSCSIIFATLIRRVRVFIHEKGLLYELIFVPWESIKGVKRWKNYIILELKGKRLGQPTKIVLRYDDNAWRIINSRLKWF